MAARSSLQELVDFPTEPPSRLKCEGIDEHTEKSEEPDKAIPPPPWCELPVEVFCIILSYLPLRSVLAFSQINKLGHALAWDNAVWLPLLHNDFPLSRTPLPALTRYLLPPSSQRQQFLIEDQNNDEHLHANQVRHHYRVRYLHKQYLIRTATPHSAAEEAAFNDIRENWDQALTFQNYGLSIADEQVLLTYARSFGVSVPQLVTVIATRNQLTKTKKEQIKNLIAELKNNPVITLARHRSEIYDLVNDFILNPDALDAIYYLLSTIPLHLRQEFLIFGMKHALAAKDLVLFDFMLALGGQIVRPPIKEADTISDELLVIRDRLQLSIYNPLETIFIYSHFDLIPELIKRGCDVNLQVFSSSGVLYRTFLQAFIQSQAISHAQFLDWFNLIFHLTNKEKSVIGFYSLQRFIEDKQASAQKKTNTIVATLTLLQYLNSDISLQHALSQIKEQLQKNPEMLSYWQKYHADQTLAAIRSKLGCHPAWYFILGVTLFAFGISLSVISGFVLLFPAAFPALYALPLTTQYITAVIAGLAVVGGFFIGCLGGIAFLTGVQRNALKKEYDELSQLLVSQSIFTPPNDLEAQMPLNPVSETLPLPPPQIEV